jgi:hypothetical protein
LIYFPAPPSLTPNFGVEFLKLFLKSPSTPESHGISCHGKNDSTVVYLAGITAPALLLLQTLMAVVALEIFRKVAKLCADWCFCLLYSLCMLLSLLLLLLSSWWCCCCKCCIVVVVSCSFCPLGRVFCPLGRVFCCDVCHPVYPLCRVVTVTLFVGLLCCIITWIYFYLV